MINQFLKTANIMYAINNTISIIPSFLSYFSCVLPNMKHKMVTATINSTSISMLELRGIALIALLAPSTKSMLKMFDPITLPITS